MARDYYIFGECLVNAIGGAHLSGHTGFLPVITYLDEDPSQARAVLAQLGLASDSISIKPKLFHKNIHVNDFGPDVPVNVMTQLQYVDISMTLIHYDSAVLETCWAEAVGQRNTGSNVAYLQAAGAGTLIGNGRRLYSSGNRFMTLNLVGAQADGVWQYPNCYLTSEPFVYPVGTKTSHVELNWRSIPYAPFNANDVRSSGRPLWLFLDDPDPSDDDDS